MNTAVTEECSVAQVISAIQQRKNPGPATLDHIRRALPKPIQPTKEVLARLLAEGVQEGRIWEYPAKADQTAYWTQSPFEMVAQKVHSLLEKSDLKESVLKKKMIVPVVEGRIDPSEVLSRLVAEGKIFALPTPSPSAQIEYSLNPVDVSAITTAAWAKIEAQLLVKDRTGRQLKSTLQPALRGVLEPQEFLQALIADRRLYLTSGSIDQPNAIFSLKPIDVEAAKQKAWNLIEQKLKSKKQTEQQIHKLVDPILKGVLEPFEYIRSLVAGQRLFSHPIKANSAEVTYGLTPIDHKPAVQKLVSKLVLDLEKLAEKNGLAIKDLYEIAMAQIRSQASAIAPVASESMATPAEHNDSTTSQGNDQPLKDRILATLHKVNPRVEDGELFLVRELREQVELHDVGKIEFDRAMLEMFRDRVIVLSRQWSGHAPDADRDRLVTDGKGNFYNTVALWRD